MELHKFFDEDNISGINYNQAFLVLRLNLIKSSLFHFYSENELGK